MASVSPDCAGWAYGLTQYLAYEDPVECIRWALELVKPFAGSVPSEVAAKCLRYLDEVLAAPQLASLESLEEIAWLAWCHRGTDQVEGPISRLLWAAEGAVAAAQGKTELISSRDTLSEPVGRRVSDQSAGALHMLALDHPEVPCIAAHRFTTTVCSHDLSQDWVVSETYSLTWESLAYEFSIIETSDGGFHLEFVDPQGQAPLYSGPFRSMEEIRARCELLRFQLKVFRITPIE